MLLVATASAQVAPAANVPEDFSFRISTSKGCLCSVTYTIDSTAQTYTRRFAVVYDPEAPHTVVAAVPVSEDVKRTLYQWVQENRFFSSPAYVDPNGNRDKYDLHRTFRSTYELEITAAGVTHRVHWQPATMTSDPARRLHALGDGLFGQFRQMPAVTALPPIGC